MATQFTQEVADQSLVWALADAEAERLQKETYGRQNGVFRGCSVGCELHSFGLSANEIQNLDSVHSELSSRTGKPEWLLQLQDKVFEGLPDPDHVAWHTQLAEALSKAPKPVNWDALCHRVHVGILRISYRTAGTSQEVVQRVIDLHERALTGEAITDEDWSAAWSAARSAARAAWSAARSAESAAARSAEWSAESAEWSAESAARSAESAESAAARSAARSAEWSAESAARSAARSAWSAAWSAARAAWSAARSAESAARSAEWSAESAAFQEIRDVILEAISAREAA